MRARCCRFGSFFAQNQKNLLNWFSISIFKYSISLRSQQQKKKKLKRLVFVHQRNNNKNKKTKAMIQCEPKHRQGPTQPTDERSTSFILMLCCAVVFSFVILPSFACVFRLLHSETCLLRAFLLLHASLALAKTTYDFSLVCMCVFRCCCCCWNIQWKLIILCEQMLCTWYCCFPHESRFTSSCALLLRELMRECVVSYLRAVLLFITRKKSTKTSTMHT